MISIIGAGPVGSFAAYLLAKAGKDVNIYEEHREIGRPVHCAGLFSSAITKFVSMEEDFVLNTPDRFKIYAPNGEYAEIETKENYVVDREQFDNYLAEKSMDMGVKYFLGCKFQNFRNGEITFDSRRARTDILIGADGPTSRVAHEAGLYYGRRFAVGMQTVSDFECEEDLICNYIGKGYFGWVIPEDNKKCRIGVIAEENCKDYFNSFLKKLNAKCNNFISRLIPIYNPDADICKGNVFLAGDAAMHVKPTTFGGVVHGLMGARELAKAIIDRRDYGKLCKKSFGRDLRTALLIRNKLNRMSDEDFNYLIKLVKQQRIKNILSKYERDYASKILFKILVREPRFLKFLFV